MRKKYRIIGLILSTLLVATSALCLVGCGEEPYVPEYAWGKSFEFRGVTIDDKNASGGTPQKPSSTRVDLIKSEYGKDNLDFANALVNGEKLDLTSYKGANVDEFISKLDNLAKTKLNDVYSGITFTVGSEENPTLKIAKGGEEKTYELRKNEGYAQDAHYDVMADSTSGGTLGLFALDIARNVNNAPTKGCLVFSHLTGEKIIGEHFGIIIKIPTKEICNDPTAETNRDENNEIVSTYLILTYTPCFSKK